MILKATVVSGSRDFQVAPGQTVLDAALLAGLNLPHSCRGGNCGSCRARLLAGQVDYPQGAPLGLSEAEVAEGFILLCRARALSDLKLDIGEVRSAAEEGPKRLPCRIERLAALAPDVMGVYLKLPAAESFRFEPGQYLDMLLPQGRRRSFSIASPPHDARPLELHVRRVAGGAFSEGLFHDGKSGALLNIEGPLGRFKYRPAQRPLLLVGGGTGLAPLKSILRHVLESGIDQRVSLYWGVRSLKDLYDAEFLNSYAAKYASFTFAPVLSEPDGEWQGRTGFVHRTVLEELSPASLVQHDVYAAGPPAMVEAVHREFAAVGADAKRIFSDAFDYARDP